MSSLRSETLAFDVVSASGADAHLFDELAARGVPEVKRVTRPSA